MRSVRLLALVLLVGAALAARAADAPHENGLDCQNCHMGHSAPGAALTKEEGNFTLCTSCHQNWGGFGFPGWTEGTQAVPGVSGRSHRWDALATNLGATPPNPASASRDEAEMGKRLDGGKLMCSTCHDVHDADYQPTSGRGRQTISLRTDGTLTRLDALPVGGTGQLTIAGTVAAGAAARRYLIDIVGAGGPTDALFRLSNDNGNSWYGCSAPTTYAPYVTWVDAATTGCRAGANVALNDGTNIAVAFGAGTYVVGDQFKSHVAYPFLRADVTNSKMCLTCHKDRNMTTANVQGGGNHAGTGQPVVPGTTVFHHPVMEAVSGPVLDVDGGVQGAGDPISANDLQLGAGGVVSCLTCHRVHNADSNSLSVH